jgi:hypothetical protein
VPNDELLEKLKQIQKIRDQASKIQTLKSGGVDSGGGTIVTMPNGRKVLLDIANFAPEYIADPSSSHSFPYSETMKNTGIAMFSMKELGYEDHVVKLLAAWKVRSQNFVGEFSGILNRKFIFVDANLSPKWPLWKRFEVHVEDQWTNLPLQPAAYFDSAGDTWISLRTFQSLSYYNQLALLIHERVRYYNASNQLGLTNQELQKITVAILRGPQTSDETLEDYSSARQNAKDLREMKVNEVLLEMRLVCNAVKPNCVQVVPEMNSDRDIPDIMNFILQAIVDKHPEGDTEQVRSYLVNIRVLQLELAREKDEEWKAERKRVFNAYNRQYDDKVFLEGWNGLDISLWDSQLADNEPLVRQYDTGFGKAYRYRKLKAYYSKLKDYNFIE